MIAPIATELPEKFNSVIWVRQGKDTLAMGNITGAMVFQSTIPTVVALLFAADAWHFSDGSRIAFASAGIAFLASAAIFIPMARSGRLRGRRLLVGGAFYVVYLAIVGVARPLWPRRASVAEAVRGAACYTRPTVRRPSAAARAADPRRSVRMLTQKSSPAEAAASREAAPAADPHAAPAPRDLDERRSPTSRATSSRCATPRSAS